MDSSFLRPVLPVVLCLAMVGCRSGVLPHVEVQLGAFQPTRSGRVCSCLTSVFAGPVTARGRNEGYLKSGREIQRLFPLASRKAKRYHERVAAAGYTRGEYHDVDNRSALNLGMFPDVLDTLLSCAERELVSPRRAQALARHLAQCNYLNGRTLAIAIDIQAITPAEARQLFLDQLRVIGNWRQVGLHYLPGNETLVGGLLDRKAITDVEARYLVLAWLCHLRRPPPNLLAEAAALEVLDECDMHRFLEVESLRFRAMCAAAGMPGFEPPEPDELRECRKTLRREVVGRLRKGLATPSSLELN
jgi:hypothetical protein